MPVTVRTAAILMWLLWVSGVVCGVLIWLPAYRMGRTEQVLPGLLYIAILLLFALLIRAITRGRNWARITYAAFAIFAIVVLVRGSISSVGSGTGTQLMFGASLIAYGAVLILLYQSSANKWFKQANAT
jgi:hypothetical protein